MKSYSTSSVIREIKTEYMLTSMAKLKKAKMSSVDEDTDKRNPHTLIKDSICRTTLENSNYY